MNRVFGSVAIAAALLLAGCGGGGDIASTPPTPTPTPTNATINDLTVSQRFAADAASGSYVFDTTSSSGISGSAGQGALEISYDAATKGYTLAYAGRTQTFATADSTYDGADQTIYRKPGENGSNLLNLFKNTYDPQRPIRYVRLGFWQNIARTPGQQTTDYTAFTYGLPTAAAEVPKTGKAALSIEVFGVVSALGREPASFGGIGDFTADFGSGLFAAESLITTTGLVSGQTSSGDDLKLSARGSLSAANGTFTGSSIYESGAYGAAGVLNGRFYGPGAAEIGASFSGTGINQTSIVTYAGSMIGLRDAAVTPANLTLTSLTSPELFYTYQSYNQRGSIDRQDGETFTYSPATSDLNGGQFTINDKVAAANPNFTSYRKTFTNQNGTQDTRLDLYRPGSGNTELALTYASFGHWSTVVTNGTAPQPVDQYFTYGLQQHKLGAMSGTARYNGVVYGTGSGGPNDPRYTLKGSSLFDVDFGKNTFSGHLAIAGTPTTGGQDFDFGSFTFTGGFGSAARGIGTELARNGNRNLGLLETLFYGPGAEEIAGPFRAQFIPDGGGIGVNLAGITVAKRQ